MTEAHDRLISEITSEYPTEVGQMAEFSEKLEPPVSKEHLRELCNGDPELLELFDEMIEYFYRYTEDACRQERLVHQKDGFHENKEEIKAAEEVRSRSHTAMIDSVRILARNLRKKGKDVSWIDGIDERNRPWYARLALLTTLNDILKQDHSS